MPFGFGRRKDEPAQPDQPVAAADSQGPREALLHGLTEDWRLLGTVEVEGRLLDLLNRREALAIRGVRWAPADGSGELEPAPGIQSLDPYDLVVILAGPDSMATRSHDEREAHRIHKVSFDVALDAPPYRVVGTVQLHPGSEPESLLERSSQMFVALTDPAVSLDDRELDLGPETEAVLVNRFYLRGVQQVDRATGQPHQRLPGQPMGGTNWHERT